MTHCCLICQSVYFTGSSLGLYRPISTTKSTNPSRMLLKANKQSQEAGASQEPLRTCREVVTSMNQSTIQIIEGSVMDWSMNDSLYSRFKTLKLKCENVLEVELASMPDTRK